MTAQRIIANSNPLEQRLGIQPMSKEDRDFWANRGREKPEKVVLNYSELIGVPIAMLLVGLCLLGWAVVF